MIVRWDCRIIRARFTPSLAAVALGAKLLEVHVVLSRECFGPDVKASVTTAELAQLVEGVRFIERALAHPLDKEQMAAEMGPLKAMFGKSVVAARDLPARPPARAMRPGAEETRHRHSGCPRRRARRTAIGLPRDGRYFAGGGTS